jgi:predicted permease
MRLRSLLRRSEVEWQLDKELRFHLEQQIQENLGLGMPPAEARFLALRSLGGVTQIQEECRDMRRTNYLEDLWQDLHYTFRTLAKTPGFAVTATLTLALGIGATTAIFTLVHEVLLKSLPVANPSQLYLIGKDIHCCVWNGYSQDGGFSLFSYELYTHFRDNTSDKSHGFEELAAFQPGLTMLSAGRAGSSEPSTAYFGEFVSGNYFSMFGIRPFAGRDFRKTDDRAGAPVLAMISYRVWQEKYALDPAVIGSSFSINGTPVTIAGVTPPGFFGDTLRSSLPDFWIPLSAEPLLHGQSSILNQPDTNWLNIIGRVPAGANTAAIEAQLRVELHQWLMSHLADMSPYDRDHVSKQTTYLSAGGAGADYMRGEYRKGLQLLMTASSFVLLIACANIANLMLVRGSARRRQTSLRMALGARRSRLIRQALTESILLALFGGAAGLAVAYGGTRAILQLAFAGTQYVPIHATPSFPVLLFTFAVTLATGVLFGIAPAWTTSHSDPVEALRGAGRSTSDLASLPQRTLVILQAALSLVLLSAAGLLTQSLSHLEHLEEGFKTGGRQIVSIDPVLAGYRPEQLELLFRKLHDRLAQIPGVPRVGYAMYSPLSGDNWDENIYIPGRTLPPDDTSPLWERVSPDYFETVGTRVIRGRSITDRDTAASQHVAVVNEAFVRQFFRNENALGKHFGKSDAKYAGDYEIVGVTEDTRYESYEMQKPVRAMFFLPTTQSTQYRRQIDSSTETRSHYLHTIVLQTAPGVQSVEGPVRRALQQIDPNLAVIRMQSFADQVNGNFTQQQLLARLTLLFGLLALVLASIGLYGVTAYSVARRTSEIGIRMALGADRKSVLAMVLRSAFLLAGVGLILGVPLTIGADRLLNSQLYGVGSFDPLTLAGAVLMLAFCAFVAGLIPARRAASIQPMDALRTE